ncbi:MAG: hypothetical protein HY884_07735 [Deltaproteobacteria bacterium]|nr:hypothetical protein [Deltaproteobacteria bacterium]
MNGKFTYIACNGRLKPGTSIGNTLFFSSFRLSAVAVILLFAYGCAGEKAVVRPPYDDLLKAWTRSVKVYNGLDTTIYATATFKSPEFREAYITRYADGIKAAESLKMTLLEKETGEFEKYNEFFISVYTADDKWNDLEKPNSVWKLYLEDGRGARVTPVSVKKVDRDDALVKEFFPYLDAWSTAYVARFPKYTETGAEPIPGNDTLALRLIITGVFGDGTLEWRLK